MLKPPLVLLILIGLLFGCVKPREPKVVTYTPERVTETSGNPSWIFHKEPPLDLENQENFIRDVNVALRAAELPEIDAWVPEKICEGDLLMKRNKPSRIYEWPDYPLGVLWVRRGYQSPVGIWKITLMEKQKK